jgi:hypothetical protein
VAESCTICSSRSRRPVRKLLDTPSYKVRLDKLVPVLNLVLRNEDVWESGGIVPRILNLAARWRWVVSFTPRPLDDRCSIPGTGNEGNFSLRHPVQTVSGAHTASYSMATGGPSSGVNWSGRENDHSPQSSAEVKNAWCYISTPPIRPHVVGIS